jgi:FkbM family methyltransferase
MSRYMLLLFSVIAMAWFIRSNSSPSIENTISVRKNDASLQNEKQLQKSLEQRLSKKHLPAPVFSGATSCADVFQLVDTNTWTDPNHGTIFARKLVSWPSFYVSVHNRRYDHVRWNSIYRKGAYYESDVHDRFVDILMQPSSSDQHRVVIDVGMNIGYYTLLSAALGVDGIVAFEINPTNVVRMCESLRLNKFENQVSIIRRGVSNVDGTQLHFHVPSNPGEASMITDNEIVTTVETKTSVADLKHDPSTVTTITLDAFAQNNGWFSSNVAKNFSIPILKIDVEGLEPQVLLGASQLLQSGLVKNVLTEFRHLNRAVSQQAFQLLFTAGYRLVDSRGVVTSREESERWIHRLTVHPLSDPTKSVWQKTRSVFLAAFITDLWFTLSHEDS